MDMFLPTKHLLEYLKQAEHYGIPVFILSILQLLIQSNLELQDVSQCRSCTHLLPYLWQENGGLFPQCLAPQLLDSPSENC